MIGMRSIAALATVLSVVYAAAVPEAVDEWHTTLLKRQAPGTPAYACHSACGTAITLSRGTSPCTDSVFLADYAECLACAGPSNVNIWIFYGNTLSAAGTRCGLSITPASGAVSSSTTPIAVTEASSTSTSIVAVPETTTAVTEATSSSTSIVTVPETTTAPVPGSTSATATSSITPVATTSATTTATSTLTAGNSTSTVIPFTGAADSVQGKAAGAFALVGAAVLAAIL